MKEFSNSIPEEFLEDVIAELASILEMDINFKIIEDAAMNDGEPNPDCVCIFRKNNSFVLVDVRNIDILKGLVVRCEEHVADDAKKTILKWDKIARERYHQEVRVELDDEYQRENSKLKTIASVNGIEINKFC